MRETALPAVVGPTSEPSDGKVTVYAFRCLRCGYDAPARFTERDAEKDQAEHVHDERLRQFYVT